ncbi:MAG TPA: nicotinamide-nucleotide amidohydrolase family protein [Actinomycetales bacterium]|nr:nicotinamide-nucleotide amidohydrolase family protein [Actinomycetales bacterium]
MSELRTTALIQTLVRRAESISCAESLTGGLVTSELIRPTGASEVVKGGLVAYATDIKLNVLGVPDEVISRHGTVSEETALAMARGARKLFGSYWGVATTGVAGPGEHEGKPAGTVFIALVGGASGAEISRVQHHAFSGSREAVRRESSREAVNMVALILDLAREQNEQSRR